MTLAETVSQLAVKASGPLTDLAVAAFGALCLRATVWVHAHSKNKLILDMTDRATTEAKSAVAAAAQITVDDLKAKTGKLSPADAAQIKSDVIAKIKANLGGDQWVQKAQDILGVTDIEAFLSTKVEEAVKTLAVVPVATAPISPATAK